jgi:hypothetical protein
MSETTTLFIQDDSLSYFCNRRENKEKTKENYLAKRIPLALASRRKLIPIGEIAIGARGSRYNGRIVYHI